MFAVLGNTGIHLTGVSILLFFPSLEHVNYRTLMPSSTESTVSLKNYNAYKFRGMVAHFLHCNILHVQDPDKIFLHVLEVGIRTSKGFIWYDRRNRL